MRRLFAAALVCLTATSAAAQSGRFEAPNFIGDFTVATTGVAGFDAFLADEAAAIRATMEEIAIDGGGKIQTTLKDVETFRGGGYFSILRSIETRRAGDGAALVEPMVWSESAGDLASLDAWFTPGAARDEALSTIAIALRRGVAVNVWGGRVPNAWALKVREATEPDGAILSNFTLAAGDQAGKAAGLSFHYAPGEVSDSGRAVTLTLPHDRFARWLNGAGRALFGGALRR